MVTSISCRDGTSLGQPLRLVPIGEIENLQHRHWGVRCSWGHVPIGSIYVRFAANYDISICPEIPDDRWNGREIESGSKPCSPEPGTDFYKLPPEGIFLLHNLICFTDRRVPYLFFNETRLTFLQQRFLSRNFTTVLPRILFRESIWSMNASSWPLSYTFELA